MMMLYFGKHFRVVSSNKLLDLSNVKSRKKLQAQIFYAGSGLMQELLTQTSRADTSILLANKGEDEENIIHGVSQL